MLERESNQYMKAIAYQIQKKGNDVNGDSFFMKAMDEYFICAVADGLGSGQHAHASSKAICEVVEQHHEEEVERLIDYCNQVLKDRRGATVSILKIDFSQKKFTYGSVGNIEFILHSPSGRFIYPIPVMGFLSGKPQKYQCETFSYEEGSKFIIHTDGLLIPGIKSLISNSRTIEEISNHLELYTQTRKDDLTYVIGQLY
ncbi:PP2C family serine/threonine-protein phosphatase [Bacillus salipaludis]|uniref:PP2C family serine/threonine-protein phosphatase n=1 Tax=Bacillus salipaludis TaxID=2547811 RepID=UPI002E1A3FCD|nr:PP2C family serine/threonine-protein phosphatase [Bacillus salipaludis]